MTNLESALSASLSEEMKAKAIVSAMMLDAVQMDVAPEVVKTALIWALALDERSSKEVFDRGQAGRVLRAFLNDSVSFGGTD